MPFLRGDEYPFYEEALARCLSLVREIDSSHPVDLVMEKPRDAAEAKVTVILPMFNARDYIERCVKSVLCQTFCSFELHCVDDHSQDDTYARVVDQFGSDYRLSVFRLRNTVGPYQIKNWILSRVARGTFIAMQDGDDVSHPTRLARQIAFLGKTGASVCGTSVHQLFTSSAPPRYGCRGVKIKDQDGWYHSLALYRSQRTCGATLPFGTILGEHDKDYIAMHGSQLFLREALVRYGGFDGRTRLGADTDLNWRMLRFEPVHNLRCILYTRTHHRNSLTHSAATGIGSDARAAYVLRRDAREKELRNALKEENTEEIVRLRTEDCYFGDVQVEASHLNWDLAADIPT